MEKLAPNRSPAMIRLKNWLRFGALESTITRIPAHVASILMPLSETGSGYGINFGVIEKFFAESLYFSPSHDLPLEGDFKNYSESTIKTGLPIPYLVKDTANFLPDDLIFRSSRDLPLEGRNFSGDTRKNGASHS